MAQGTFCLVLHGHLPWVLHHGRWPHGEDWLHEAASETWLPLFGVLDRLAADGIRPAWSVGMTPVLLEQLSHPRFVHAFPAWLAERRTQARSDEAEFSRRGDVDLAALADHTEAELARRLDQFDGLARDLPGAWRRAAESGAIEGLGSNATHGYHPLILHDRCARAQIRIGLATTLRHLGVPPTAAWLPECAYRPPGWWAPPALHGDPRWREGVGRLWAEAGVRSLCFDGPTLAAGKSAWTLDGTPVAVGADQAGWDHARAWLNVNETHRLTESGDVLDLTVFARGRDVSEPVWSGLVGYPGDQAYLEFHKRHGLRGHRYWRVTGPSVDLGGKRPYHPVEAEETARAHAHHFCGVVRGVINGHFARTGRHAVVTAPFDAELFGHWWHEGPVFLEAVVRELAADPDILLRTLSEAENEVPCDKAVTLAEGSWGAGGDHRVWLNDELRFYWEWAYRCEDRFLDLWDSAPWRTNPDVARLLKRAARQLLLLQASDWAFVIGTRGAVDYGLRRIAEHAAMFDTLCNGVVDLVSGAPTDPVVVETERMAALIDDLFADLDLEAWAP